MMRELQTVALFPGSELRYLSVDIARELKNKYGSEIHLYCGDKGKLNFYKSIDKN